jgi:hypothetical protein
MAKGRTLAWAAIGFALAAGLSAWNPVSAPFGFLVGLGAAVLAFRSLRLGGKRGLASFALVLALAALAASGLVLALTAGVGRDLGGEPVVSGPSREEAAKLLDQAAAESRAARERAREELGKAEEGAGSPAQPPPRPAR